MPNGSLIPHMYISRKPMPLSIYITWFIFGFRITFHGGRTFIELDTDRIEFYTTTVTIWHGRNEFYSYERGNFTEVVWRIEYESQHWVALAYELEQHGF